MVGKYRQEKKKGLVQGSINKRPGIHVHIIWSPTSLPGHRKEVGYPKPTVVEDGGQINLGHGRPETKVHHIAGDGLDLMHNGLRNRPGPSQGLENANGKRQPVTAGVGHLPGFDRACSQLHHGAEDQRTDEEGRVLHNWHADRRQRGDLAGCLHRLHGMRMMREGRDAQRPVMAADNLRCHRWGRQQVRSREMEVNRRAVDNHCRLEHHLVDRPVRAQQFGLVLGQVVEETGNPRVNGLDMVLLALNHVLDGHYASQDANGLDSVSEGREIPLLVCKDTLVELCNGRRRRRREGILIDTLLTGQWYLERPRIAPKSWLNTQCSQHAFNNEQLPPGTPQALFPHRVAIAEHRRSVSRVQPQLKG